MKKIILILIISSAMIFPSGAESRKDNPFGVLTFLPWNHSWNNYMYKDKNDLDKAISLLDELGISIIRVDFTWNFIEKEKDVFDFTRYDYLVEKCKDKGIQILAVLGYNAPWTGDQWNNPPKDKGAFIRYVEATVSRYKDQIKYWELWNEPDSFTYWCPQDDMKTYTDLLKSVYLSIKTIDPESQVLIGGFTDSGLYAFRSVLKKGGGNYFDIVNFHFFVDPINKNGLNQITHKLNNIKKDLDKYGCNKKIWITEIGCPGKNRNRKCFWWYGRCPSERQQSIFLQRAYRFLLKKEGVDKIFWAFFQDTDNHFKNGVDYFGLVRGNFSKKPAFYRYQKIIKKYR